MPWGGWACPRGPNGVLRPTGTGPPSPPGLLTPPRYNRRLTVIRSDETMEADQLNAIENHLSGLAARTAELRRYL